MLDVNLRGVVNVVKLAWWSMKRHGVAGSIVLTASATAYAPEQSLPVYAASKSGVRLSLLLSIATASVLRFLLLLLFFLWLKLRLAPAW